MLKPWTVESSGITYGDRWLTVRSDRCRTGDDRVIDPFHILEYPAWVNIVALTPASEVILVTQYRHGVREILTEIPAGTVEADDPGPETAAVRELREETGFEAGSLHCIGSGYANPANQTNRVWSYLAFGCERTHSPRPDANEDLEVKTERFTSLLRRMQRNEIDLQSFHQLALYRAQSFILRSSDPHTAPLRADLASLMLGETLHSL